MDICTISVTAEGILDMLKIRGTESLPRDDYGVLHAGELIFNYIVEFYEQKGVAFIKKPHLQRWMRNGVSFQLNSSHASLEYYGHEAIFMLVSGWGVTPCPDTARYWGGGREFGSSVDLYLDFPLSCVKSFGESNNGIDVYSDICRTFTYRKQTRIQEFIELIEHFQQMPDAKKRNVQHKNRPPGAWSWTGGVTE